MDQMVTQQVVAHLTLEETALITWEIALMVFEIVEGFRLLHLEMA